MPYILDENGNYALDEEGNKIKYKVEYINDTNQFDIDCKEKCRLGKISESQMGFEPTTLRDLVGCSNH